MPDLLSSIAACHDQADLDAKYAEALNAMQRGELGSVACKAVLTAIRARRVAIAEERRRLEAEFDRTVPAAEGVEAPEEHGDAWEGPTDGG